MIEVFIGHCLQFWQLFILCFKFKMDLQQIILLQWLMKQLFYIFFLIFCLLVACLVEMYVQLYIAHCTLYNYVGSRPVILRVLWLGFYQKVI